MVHVGMILLFVGILLMVGHIGAAQKLVGEAGDDGDALTTTDTWLNTRDRDKQRKLIKIAAEHSDRDVRNEARRVLLLEVCGVSSFLAGMIVLMLCAKWS